MVQIRKVSTYAVSGSPLSVGMFIITKHESDKVKTAHIFFLISVCFFSVLQTGCNQNSVTPDACMLTPDIGPCFAAITKFYFDTETNTCEEFIWGGCDGVVPFDTMAECEACD